MMSESEWLILLIGICLGILPGAGLAFTLTSMFRGDSYLLPPFMPLVWLPPPPPPDDGYDSLTPPERVKLCYDLRESLNKATVILDKLMLDALRSLPTSTGQRILEINPEEEEVMTESKKDAPE